MHFACKVISSASNTYEEVKAPWNWRTAAWAALNGHLHILEYLVERKYDQYDGEACENAAKYGHLDCLKYLRNRQALGTLEPYEKRTRKTTPSVYNTSSTTTVFSHTVGDTKMERYARRKRVLGYTKREREREIRSYCEINNIYTNNLNQNTPLNDANRRARAYTTRKCKKKRASER